MDKTTKRLSGKIRTVNDLVTEGYRKRLTNKQMADEFIEDTWQCAIHHPDPAMRLKYKDHILDRAVGKPPQAVDVTTDGGSINTPSVNISALTPDEVARTRETIRKVFYSQTAQPDTAGDAA
jgi:hypothetical protein